MHGYGGAGNLGKTNRRHPQYHVKSPLVPQNEEQQAIFRILAAILHLGNIYYEAVDVRGHG